MARKTVRSQRSEPKLRRKSDQTLNPKRKTSAGSLFMVGKTTKVPQRSDHKQQTLSVSSITVRKTPKPQVELPLHLVVSAILTRLPLKTLSRFRCVSKPLCSLISEPHFQKEHAHRRQQNPLLLVAKAYSTVVRFSMYNIHGGERVLKDFSISFPHHFVQPDDPDPPMVPFKLVQSCLGLVCLRTYFDGAILVFNPSTQEVITLPERPSQEWDLCVGFGYTHFSDEFKVVRFFTSNLDVADQDDNNSDYDYLAFRNREQCFCEVFTLGSSDGWRETRSPPFKPNEYAHLPLVHGALHFLPSLHFHGNMRHDHYITAFDVHTEQYRGIPLPKIYFGFQAVHQCVMAELRGSLCMSFNFSDSKKLLQLWFLKDYHGGKWVKEYNIDLSHRPSPFSSFAITRADCILMSFESSKGHELCYYNTEKGCIEQTLGTNCSAMFYVDSFLPLPLGNRMAV